MLEAHINRLLHQNRTYQMQDGPKSSLDIKFAKFLEFILPKKVVRSIVSRLVLPSSLFSKNRKHPLHKEYNDYYQRHHVEEKSFSFNDISGTLLSKGQKTKDTPTYIFACPNAATKNDLRNNTMVSDLFKLDTVNVILFDYPGVGSSKGNPRPEQAIAAGEHMYHYAEQKLNASAENIRLVGWSYGTFVMAQVAKRTEHTGKLLLYQGSDSLIDSVNAKEPRLQKVATRVLTDCGYHVFNNEKILNKLKCETHIITTTNDQIFPVFSKTLQPSEKIKITTIETDLKSTHMQPLSRFNQETLLLF